MKIGMACDWKVPVLASVVSLLAACGGGGSVAGSSNASGGSSASSPTGAPPALPQPPPTPPTPPEAAVQYVASSAYPLTGPQPYQFLVTDPGGPIPASLQPYEVWPSVDANGALYFQMDVSSTGPWGAWTATQLQTLTVAALDQDGWVVSQ
jgi:hypothetical protein